MIHYHISCTNPASQFVNIALKLEIQDNGLLLLQLPAWRAGRYQLANYAQNIRSFQVFDQNNKQLPFKKISKDCWEVAQNGSLVVRYEYWAGKMDAGSAWADHDQVYLNLVNCCFEVLGHSEEEIQVSLDLPNYPLQVSTLIPNGPSIWLARDFQMLADSTIIASKKLTHWEYQSHHTLFHIWIQGEIHFDKQVFVENFQKFTDKLIADFGEFPEEEYHFIFQLLPYPHYHGVEHRRGTVITFGPAEKLSIAEEMEELLGVSCHELYHSWNVCRIRPKELLPYDFSKEIYTECGLILEGVTTYLGDLYLLKSGVYNLSTYLKHFAKVINREANSFGWKNQNILESSFDLWLDGYVPGIPDRKVNIYTRGAVLAFCMDVLLIRNGSSLPQVMQKMWERFGKPLQGYTLEDFQSAVFEEFSEQEEIQNLFHDYVCGHRDIFPKLRHFFQEIGIRLEAQFGEDWMLHEKGIRLNPDGIVSQIHPESEAFHTWMKDDRIEQWPLDGDKKAVGSLIKIHRHGKLVEVPLSETASEFYPEYRLVVSSDAKLSVPWIS